MKLKSTSVFILFGCLFLVVSCSSGIIPSRPGVVVSHPLTLGKSKLNITCITERHASPKGQQKQLNLLKDILTQADKPLIIGIEGAPKGIIDVQPYGKYLHDKNWKPFFLQELTWELEQGVLTAAEFLALSEPNKVKLVGLENREEYTQALTLYQKIKNIDFQKFHEELNPLTLYLFPRLDRSGQKDVNSLLKGLSSHQIEFTDFVRKINRIYNLLDLKLSRKHFPKTDLIIKYWNLVDKRSDSLVKNLHEISREGKALLICGQAHQERVEKLLARHSDTFQVLDIPDERKRGTPPVNRNYLKNLEINRSAAALWLNAALRPPPVITNKWYHNRLKLLMVSLRILQRLKEGRPTDFEIKDSFGLKVEFPKTTLSEEPIIIPFQLARKQGKIIISTKLLSNGQKNKILEQGKLTETYFYHLIKD